MLSVYLDVDGVLRGCASPKEDIEAFLRYCLDNCCVYWLTSFCRGGVNHVPRVLDGILSDELIDELTTRVQPTDWSGSKIEAIDFSEPFVWFDDLDFSSAVAERRQSAENKFFLVNSSDPESAKKMLKYLKEILGEKDGNNLSNN